MNLPLRFAFALCCATVAARADAPIDLAWKLTQGDRFTLVIDVSATASGGWTGVAFSTTRSVRFEGELKVGEIGSDRAKVELELSRAVLHMVAGTFDLDRDLAATDLAGKPIRGTLTTRGVLELDWGPAKKTLGKDVDRLRIEPLLTGLAGELPKKPTAMGEQWFVLGQGDLDLIQLVLEIAKVDAPRSVEISGKARAAKKTVRLGGKVEAEVEVEGTASATFDSERRHTRVWQDSYVIVAKTTSRKVVEQHDVRIERKIELTRK